MSMRLNCHDFQSKLDVMKLEHSTHAAQVQLVHCSELEPFSELLQQDSVSVQVSDRTSSRRSKICEG